MSKIHAIVRYITKLFATTKKKLYLCSEKHFRMKKQVALTLSSGGARGMAHIGAINALEERGYEIVHISGCSIGSLIGGIYAAGKIAESKEWFSALDRQQVFSLTDFSLGLSHIVKGDRVMQAIQEWVPDRRIEDLDVPAVFVATDLINSCPVVFRTGSLFEAIRASISIPLCFEPVRWNHTLLVDGGLVDPFPLDLAERDGDTLLAGVNISGRSRMRLGSETKEEVNGETKEEANEREVNGLLNKISNRAEELWNKLAGELDDDNRENSITSLTLVNRTIDIQIQTASQNAINRYRPDILVEMAQDAYTTFDFDKAEEIIDKGYEMMMKAIDYYEQNRDK